MIELYLVVLMALRGRLGAHPQRRSERGYTTEFIAITAALAAVAIIAVGIIAAKVMNQANAISTH